MREDRAKSLMLWGTFGLNSALLVAALVTDDPTIGTLAFSFIASSFVVQVFFRVLGWW